MAEDAAGALPLDAATGRRAGRLERWLPWLVLVPVLASATSALVQGWVVVSDGATIMVRAADVAAGRVPTLGMPTSLADFTGGPTPYHPGPLLFWVLAPFAWLLGPTLGAVVGVSAIHGAALSGSVVVARRGANRTITVGTAVAALVVAVTVFGPGHYYDPFNTPLPAVCLLFVYVCTWRLLCGDTRLLPVAIGVASFCAQVHVSYAVPVSVAIGAVLVALFGPSKLRSGRPRPSRRVVLASAAVLLACWSGPLVDAIGNGGGNLVRLSHGASGDEGTLALRGAWWTFVNLFHLPPLQLLPLDDAAFRGGPSVVTAVVAALVVYLLVRTVPRTSPAGLALLAAAAIALVGAMIDAALLPDATIEGPQITWFKVLVPFCVLALVGARSEMRDASLRPVTWRAPVAVGVVVVIASLPFPIRNSLDADSWLYDAVKPVSEELRATLDPSTTYRIRARGGTRVEMLQHALIADLDGRGWDIAVTDRNRTYYGAERVVPAGDGIVDLVVQDASLPPPAPSARVVATFDPPVDEGRRTEVQRAIADWARAHPPIVLSSEGRDHLVQALDGRDGLTARELEAIALDPALLLDEDPAVIAELYRSYWVSSPGLSGDLAADLRTVLGPTAIEVWAVPSRDVGP